MDYFIYLLHFILQITIKCIPKKLVDTNLKLCYNKTDSFVSFVYKERYIFWKEKNRKPVKSEKKKY